LRCFLPPIRLRILRDKQLGLTVTGVSNILALQYRMFTFIMRRIR